MCANTLDDPHIKLYSVYSRLVLVPKGTKQWIEEEKLRYQ